MTPRRRFPVAAVAAAAFLAAVVPGCIRFYFWAGEHELAVPPEPAGEPTPEPTPEEAAPLRT